MKEEKKVLAARGCGSLVLAFLIVAWGGGGESGAEGAALGGNRCGRTFWLCHDADLFCRTVIELLPNYCSNRVRQ